MSGDADALHLLFNKTSPGQVYPAGFWFPGGYTALVLPGCVTGFALLRAFRFNVGDGEGLSPRMDEDG